jgi:hypothetical protein
MELLQVTKENALAAHKQAEPAGRALLETLFGKNAFIATMADWEAYIMDKVKSFEDACTETGEDPDDDKFDEGEPDEIAYKKGKVVVRALNGPHVLDYSNGNQRKWEAWLQYVGSGFRFLGVGFVVSGTRTAGGSRLRLCSEKLAKYFATQFPDLMMPFWL